MCKDTDILILNRNKLPCVNMVPTSNKEQFVFWSIIRSWHRGAKSVIPTPEKKSQKKVEFSVFNISSSLLGVIWLIYPCGRSCRHYHLRREPGLAMSLIGGGNGEIWYYQNTNIYKCISRISWSVLSSL